MNQRIILLLKTETAIIEDIEFKNKTVCHFVHTSPTTNEAIP